MSLIDATVIELLANETAKTVGKLFEKNKDIPQIVEVKTSGNKLLKCRLARGTASTTKPDIPQISFSTPNDEDILITNISIIPNATFKTSGILEMSVQDSEIFTQNTVGDFTDVPILDINLRPEGKTLKRGEEFKAYLWGAGSITLFIQFERLRVK